MTQPGQPEGWFGWVMAMAVPAGSLATGVKPTSRMVTHCCMDSQVTVSAVCVCVMTSTLLALPSPVIVKAALPQLRGFERT